MEQVRVPEKKKELLLLKGKELDQALKNIREEKGLNPATVNRFLSIETSEVSRLSKLDKVVPLVLMAGYVATFAWTRLNPESLPIQMPPALDQALQAIHNLTTNAARSPTVGEHLPFLLLEAAGIWGATKTIPNWLKARGKSQRIKEAQQTVKEEIDEGRFRFGMAEGHTAAFVGFGDPLADSLQQNKKSDEVMLYSHVKINNRVWQLLAKNGQQEEIYRVLDRGDFGKAGEVLLLPVKNEDMFLPDKTGHDMTIDEVAAMIDVVDAYCKSRSLSKKRIIIVGSKSMEESYVRRSNKEKTQESQKTLGGLVDEINQQRKDGKVEIIDPTEIVMKKIISLASGRNIEFVSTKESDQRYGERFMNLLTTMEYRPKENNNVVRVLYNISDIPTATKAGQGDIAVILDPSKEQVLEAKGLPKQNIIIVPDITLQTLSREVDKS
jgi:hypothetical protein